MDDFDAIINQARHIVGTSRRIADDVYPNGARMQCATCGRTWDATTEQAARFLSTGWPTHCGATMTAEQIAR
jgi:hypothetical protein